MIYLDAATAVGPAVRWAAELGALPECARHELEGAVAELGAKFPAAYADPYRAGPAKSWVAGPGEEVPGFAEVRAVLDRRTFAMPYVGIQIGEKDYPQLDADDTSSRAPAPSRSWPATSPTGAIWIPWAVRPRPAHETAAISSPHER